MPSLNDVMEVAQALEKPVILVDEARCVAVRNRNAQCRRCIEGCMAQAITYENNQLTVDNGACVNCGACITLCPTQALSAVDPSDSALHEARKSTVAAADGTAVFACARIASKHVGDPEKYVKVPCLGRLDEGLLLQTAGEGATDILLIDGTCATCKYGVVNPFIDAAVETANTLLSAQGSPCTVKRASAFPPEFITDQKKAQAADRRGFFSHAGSLAKEAALSAAEVVIAQKLNQERNTAAKETLRQRLGVMDGGSLPHFSADRNMQVLDAMDRMGPPVEPSIQTRLFGTLFIDADRCNGCGMCVLFCPTKALVNSDEPHSEEGKRYAEFSAADCVQCRLCENVCLNRCVTVDSRVSTQELFDFEPRLVTMAEPARHGAAYFDRLHARAANRR